MPAEWDIISAFILQPSSLVSIVGGGGKTTLLFALAHAWPGRVVTTTTTRIFTAQMKLSPEVVFFTAKDAKNAKKKNFAPFAVHLSAALDRFGECLVVGEVAGEKAHGVPPALPGHLLARPDVDLVLVEADGSRMRPIKAPADHEPVIPPETTLVVPVVGIDALDGRLVDVAHRPERVASIINYQLSINNYQLTPADVAALLTHPEGGLKGAPPGARVIPFINKVETPSQLGAARQIARRALHASRIAHVVIGAVKTERPIREVHRRVTAVVLAAGQSRRMGRPKQLLPWGETTVLGQTLRHVRAAAVHDTLVITGHEAEAVAAIAAAHKCRVVHNPDYAAGEMLSSLQTAVRQLPENCAAVLVMLADQPMIEPGTIDHLLEAYWGGQGELIAPVYGGRRGNPVLIGRPYFEELLVLPPGDAPRTLLRRHADELHLVPVESDSILRDLDRPEAYERWRP
ncbi:MAG: selenium cofactor biosynthesis protein YqeC [Anaerolineae bacterium]